MPRLSLHGGWNEVASAAILLNELITLKYSPLWVCNMLALFIKAAIIQQE